jgi:hypothetical protein
MSWGSLSDDDGGRDSKTLTRRPLSSMRRRCRKALFVLHGGGLRNEPQIDRKLCAIEAVESRRLKSSSIEVA